jgi:hypothetical protein
LQRSLRAVAVLGAVAQVTQQVDLYTYVTCPTMRYHPAIVAQQAATVQILAEGRFTLGPGSRENLGEHVVGKGWPTIERRQDILREAIKIIRELFGGRLVNWQGDYFQVDSGRLWDVPDIPVGIAVAMGGAKVCWEPDRDAATDRAHDQFRWFGGAGGSMPICRRRPVSPARPGFVRPEDVAESIPCEPDLDAIVEAVQPYWECGFTDIALVQIGDRGQDLFLKEAAEPLLEALRAASKSN